MSTTPCLSVREAIRVRRTTKKFKLDPIPEATLKELIGLTIAAPSSFNLQPWRIILIDDPAQKAALAKASWNQPQITTAPVTFIFAVSISGWKDTLEPTIRTAGELGAWSEKTATYFRGSIPGFQEGLGEKQREYAIKDAVIAATHLALAAERSQFLLYERLVGRECEGNHRRQGRSRYRDRTAPAGRLRRIGVYVCRTLAGAYHRVSEPFGLDNEVAK
jgi:Nitroreductase family